MDRERLFDLWAPPDAVWSPWTKPVLFAQLSPTTLAELNPSAQSVPSTWDRLAVDWAPPVSERAALVLELPGDAALRSVPALLARGYRPVPLYNTMRGPDSLVPVGPLMEGLLFAAGELLSAGAALPKDAPPAFLLDSRRTEGVAQPGRFDNRWVVLPQDFPSATFLRQHDIRSVWLVQGSEGLEVKDDLRHVLRRWSEGGLPLMRATLSGQGPEPLSIGAPKWYRSLWHTLIALGGFRRNNVGGFGAHVPEASSGGGYS